MCINSYKIRVIIGLIVCYCALLHVCMANEWKINRAWCEFRRTKSSPYIVNGYMKFERLSMSSDDITVTWDIEGLSPGGHNFHVHTHGDFWEDSGDSSGGHFNGSCVPCRDPPAIRETGDLSLGGTRQLVANSNERAVDTVGFTDSFIALNGPNSIIGRSIIIHEVSSATRVAQCVIGRDNDEAEAQALGDTAELAPPITRAGCNMYGGYGATTTLLNGFMLFVDRSGTLDVSFGFHGLTQPDSVYPFHIHVKGHLDSTATEAGGHFVGDCSSCRSQGAQEIGTMGNAYEMRSGHTNTIAYGFFTDTEAKLNGRNSIIGRMLTIHNPVGGAIIGQCVVGIMEDTQSAPPLAPEGSTGILVPQIEEGIAVIQPADPSPTTSSTVGSPGGVVLFRRSGVVGSPSASTMNVRYFLHGLPPYVSHSWHIHDWGNLCSLNGDDVGGHFVGECNNCRPGSLVQEVGNINNGTTLSTDEYGVSMGQFEDSVLTFEGVNSIIGRSIVIHGNGTYGNTAKIGFGVIGRSVESTTRLQSAPPSVERASCSFESTLDSTSMYTVNGMMMFTHDVTSGELDIQYDIYGLPEGAHSYHVHTAGNLIGKSDGKATLNHFVGSPTPNPARLYGLNEVGALNAGFPLLANEKGRTTGAYRDLYANLTGIYDIVGRSIIIHGINGNSGTRIAQCTIGMHSTTGMNKYTDVCARVPPRLFEKQVTFARCDFTATNGGTATGNFQFQRYSHVANRNVSVTYNLCGLGAAMTHSYHVHTYGDLFDDNIKSVGGHFTGCDNCRPGSAFPNEVGYIGNGASFTTDGGGCATGSLVDDIIALNGERSIVGRSIVIHDDTSARVAQCTIGKADDAAAESVAPYGGMSQLVRRATCRLTPTTGGGGDGSGTVEILSNDINDPSKPGVLVKYYINGMTENTYGRFEIHQRGRIDDTTNGANTGGIYTGDCGGTCRPTFATQAVGNLGNGAYVNASAIGVASGAFEDAVVSLNGENSIVGRSLVLIQQGVISYQCVVGMMATKSIETRIPYTITQTTTAGVPVITRVAASITPTVLSSTEFSMYVTMNFDNSTQKYRARVIASGLKSSTQYSLSVYTYGNECDNTTTNIGALFKHVNNQALFQSDGSGRVLTVLPDADVVFNGVNSIVGRVLVLNEGTTTIVGKGAIGRLEEDTYNGEDVPYVSYATCKLRGTNAYPNIVGDVEFKWISARALTQVRYLVRGLPTGARKWYIHNDGDSMDRMRALSGGDVSFGMLDDTRPYGSEQYVGAINNNEPMVANDEGVAYGSFVDTHIDLNGVNSIIGRSVVLLSDNDINVNIAMCTIGIVGDVTVTTAPTCASLPSTVSYAVARMQATSLNADQNLYGNVYFSAIDSNVLVSWSVCGLSIGSHSMHVHEYGDIRQPNGDDVGGHWPGNCTACRPTTPPCQNEVGCIASASALVSVDVVDSSGCSVGAIADPVIKLKGLNSVVGRGLIIHGISGNSGTRAAQAVIGRADTDTVGELVEYTRVRNAVCRLQSTSVAEAHGYGFVEIREDQTTNYDDVTGAGTYRIRIITNGIKHGDHDIHVHTLGDLRVADGSSVLGHFVGDCNNCRPGSDLQEIGRIGNGKYQLSGRHSIGSGYLSDSIITLNGLNSIIGRSVIIHGSGALKSVEQQVCVLGIAGDNDEPAPPPNSFTQIPMTLRAGCKLLPTNENAPVDGDVTFEFIEGSSTWEVAVRYSFVGLSTGTHTWHINEYGNQCKDDGSDTGTQFTAAVLTSPFTADSDGRAEGYFETSSIVFSGTNSIIGRSLIIQGDASSSSTVVATCVIGRTNEASSYYQEETPSIDAASCRLTPTFEISPSSKYIPLDIRGYILFKKLDAQRIEIDLHASNLPVGTHKIGVMERGDQISLDNADATLSYFVGDGTQRTSCTNNCCAVGCVNNGAPLTITGLGQMYATIIDDKISFNGVNSIIGRSIVIMGNGETNGENVRIAQCVVGIASEEAQPITNPTCDLLSIIDEPSDSTLSIGVVLGITFGCIGGVLMCIFLIWLTRPLKEEYMNRSKGYSKEETHVDINVVDDDDDKKDDTIDVEMDDMSHMQQGPEAPRMPRQPSDSINEEQKRRATIMNDDLPPDWEMHHDDNNRIYYYNQETGESTWTRPTTTA